MNGVKNILFEASDCGYEYGWRLQIYELNGKLYLEEDQWDPFIDVFFGLAPTDAEPYTEEISQEDALELMLEHVEYEDEDYLDDFHSCAWIGRVV